MGLRVVVVTRIEGGIPEIIQVTDTLRSARSQGWPFGPHHELWETGYYAPPDTDVEWRVDDATMDPAAFERMGAERYGGLFALMLAAHKHNKEVDA
jgi:hypothetical protein